MKTAEVLLLCCMLPAAIWQLTSAQGDPCTVDAAGTRGDCRTLSLCPTLFRKVEHTRPCDASVARLRELTKKCPRSPDGILQLCCQNEVTCVGPAKTCVKTSGLGPTEPAGPTAPALLPTDECGRSFLVSRVINGEDAEIGEFPWTVSIQHSLANGTELIHSCGGTLITSRHVLTAAHCVTYLASYQYPDRAAKSVILGEMNFDSDKDCLKDDPNICADPTIEVKIDKIFAHEDFQNIPQFRYPNDIAIVRLAHTVNFTDFIQPICLLTNTSALGFGKSDTDPNSTAIVAGWGRSSFEDEEAFTPALQKARLPVRPIAQCERQYAYTLERRICAGAGSDQTDTCRGDSGGPLMVPDRHGTRWYQTGVSSIGSNKCNTVSIYTRVLDYTNWIMDVLRRDIAQFNS